MYAEAERQTPEIVRRSYVDVYREMRAAGYTAVGEFHYLGVEGAVAAGEAAEEAGIAIVILYAAYARGGLPRFRQESVSQYLGEVEALRERGIAVAVAPHSVRACPEEWLTEIARYADDVGALLHVHACEQLREIEECVAEYDVRPIEVLARTGCLGPHTTIIHGTHASDSELDLVRDAGSLICACPTTEANLGDGYLPIAKLCDRGIGVCIGSDSNVRIDPLEELREIEGIARRDALKRNVVSTSTLLSFGTDEGARALGLQRWDEVALDLEHRTLRDVPEDAIYDALVFSADASVFVQ